MPLSIGTIASGYVFDAPTLSILPVVSFMGDATTSVFLSSTTGTWSAPIINTTYEWLSSTDNSTWFTTNITQSSSSFFGLDNTYLKTIVRGVDINLTPISATSLSIYTSGMSFKLVVLQLNGDTIMPVLKDTFIDSSSNNFIITKSGTPTQGTFSPFSYTLSGSGVAYNPTVHGGSGYFNGSSYLTAPWNNNLGTGDFTVEYWTYHNGFSQNAVGASVAVGHMEPISQINYWSFGTVSNGTVKFYYFNGSQQNLSTSISLSLNRWYHIAVTSASNTLKIYVDGFEQASGLVVGTPSWSSDISTPITIGSNTNTLFNGFISNLRIVKDVVLYPSGFTPSTAPLTTVTNTSLLLNFTNSTVLDGIGKNNISLNGNASVSNTSKQYGVGSLSFDGTGDWITTPNTSNFDLSNASTNFTIEAWVYNTSPSTYRGITGARLNGVAHGWCLYIHIDNTLYLGATIIGNLFANRQINSTVIPGNTWTHVALVKTSSGYIGYVNGVSGALITLTGGLDYQSAQPLTVGALASQGEYSFSGYIDDLRITKGVARYPSQAFPAAALSNTSSGDVNFRDVSLLLQADSIIPISKDNFLDSSSNNFPIIKNGSVAQGSFSLFPLNGAIYNPAVHGGSAYFNGNGSTNHLAAPINAFNFGTGDFTVEFWVNPTLQASYNGGRDFTIIGGEYSGSGVLWGIGVSSYNGYRGLSFTYGQNGSYTVGIHTNNWLTANRWQHVAVTRRGTTWRIFVDGVSQTLSTYSEGTTWNPAANFINATVTTSRIGTGGLTPFYLSDVRFIKGTALYTGSTLAVPTTPLTSVTSTSLLLNFTNSSVIDITNTNNVSVNGNAGVSNNVMKFGVGALSFDGTGDYLSVPVSSNLTLGTGDFTIEAWVYMNSGGNRYTLFNTTPHNTLAISLNRTGVGDTYVYTGNGSGWLDTTSIISNTNLSFSAWHHVALVKNGSTVTLYHNGVRAGSTSLVPSGFTGSIYIGSIFTFTPSEYFNGYIDDFRITKAARYTGSTFTLPTTAYPVK